MKKHLAFLSLLMALPAVAQQSAFNGTCLQGGVPAVTSGAKSSNYLNGIIPHCSVTVYLTGTLTKATITTDGSTPLSNPFFATTLGSAAPGQWLFYAADGVGYDVVMSGGIPPNTYVTPVTLTDVKNGGGGGSGGGCSTGGIPTTNGSVTGDNSSTNCGYNNRVGDTAGANAAVETFGSNLLTNNSGTNVTAVGASAGANNTSSFAVFVGDHAGNLQNGGSDLVMIGDHAGDSFNGGNEITAIGSLAAQNNGWSFSDFIGEFAGRESTTGTTGSRYADCMGYTSCNDNDSAGDYLIGIGPFTSSGNRSGSGNIVGIGNASGTNHAGVEIIAIGDGSGDGPSVGSVGDNIIALGQGSGVGTGSNVIALGQKAIGDNGNSGNELIAFGDHALDGNTTGGENIAIGDYAGANGFVGPSTPGFANLTGNRNVWVGTNAGPNTATQLSNTIGIGYQAYNTASNQTTIGNSSTTSLKLFGCPTGQTAYDDGSGNCYVPSGGGAVSSVANSDSTLTISPTTGAVVASLNLAHANTWTAPVTVNDGSGNSGAIQVGIGTDAGGASGKATYMTDATNGYAEVHEGTAALSRICTAANGICATSIGGTCAMSTSTSCTITLGHTYTTPVCIATQQSATLTGGAVGCTVSGTTVTITSAVANSETWGAFVFGNPN